MIKTRRSPAIAWLTILLLLITICSGLIISGGEPRAQAVAATPRKLSRDLFSSLESHRLMKVFVQLNGPETPALTAFLNLHRAQLEHRYVNFPILALKIEFGSLAALAAMSEVHYVSLRKPLKKFGHISATAGADAARASVPGMTLDGSGTGIAVLDSGIQVDHPSLINNNRYNVVYSKDFTGEERTDDPYGHGTHVASEIVGSRAVASGRYTGVATGANLLNLRVLNSEGTGDVMDLLEAIDWVISNRTTYNIRVANMSLGMTAIDSFKFDPVCRAVRKMVDSGIVAVAAAGNNGKDDSGEKVYGYIHTPGIEPSVITVGATNTYNTNSRRDDRVTTYSSRGPARGSWTDIGGIVHYDNLIKPDIVAPGNKIVGAQSTNNWIITNYPQLNVPTTTAGMMKLSGTSMAAPIVAGAAALLLQANPRLTPNMVKMILMYTAQPLAGFNTFEQGAGQVNIEGAVRLARLVRTTLKSSTPLGSPMLTTLTPPTPSTTIAGYTIPWSQFIVLHHTCATGVNLITQYQKVYNQGILLGAGVIEGYATQKINPLKMTSGITLTNSINTSNGNPLGEGSVFLSTEIMLANGIMLGDGVVMGDGIMLGDGVVMGDNGTTSDGIMLGD